MERTCWICGGRFAGDGSRCFGAVLARDVLNLDNLPVVVRETCWVCNERQLVLPWWRRTWFATSINLRRWWRGMK